MILAGADVQIAFIGLLGAIGVAMITGVFGLLAANRNRTRTDDTSQKVASSVERLGAFETLYHDYTLEKTAKEYLEKRVERLMNDNMELRQQLRDALRGQPPAADSPT